MHAAHVRPRGVVQDLPLRSSVYRDMQLCCLAFGPIVAAPAPGLSIPAGSWKLRVAGGGGGPCTGRQLGAALQDARAQPVQRLLAYGSYEWQVVMADPVRAGSEELRFAAHVHGLCSIC